VAKLCTTPEPTCKLCAENHDTRVCPNKEDVTKTKCSNCNQNHAAGSKICEEQTRRFLNLNRRSRPPRKYKQPEMRRSNTQRDNLLERKQEAPRTRRDHIMINENLRSTIKEIIAEEMKKTLDSLKESMAQIIREELVKKKC